MWHMKTVVIYESHVGSTKKYAEEIAEKVGGDVFPRKKFKFKKKLDEYDVVVYGGWVKGSQIQGLNDFLFYWDDMKEKHVIVFSCGMSFPSAESRKDMINANVLDLYHLRYYQLQGSFEFKKLDPINRFLISNSLRLMAKDDEFGASARGLADIKDNPLIVHDEKGIEKIVNVIRRLDKVVEVEPNEEEK